MGFNLQFTRLRIVRFSHFQRGNKFENPRDVFSMAGTGDGPTNYKITESVLMVWSSYPFLEFSCYDACIDMSPNSLKGLLP